jgi:hypothetical protein
MQNLPLVKWHAQELHKLLSQEPNNPYTVQIAVQLEAIFLNSSTYKDIKAQPPEDHK